MELLQFSPRRASAFYLKVLKSAVANAARTRTSTSTACSSATFAPTTARMLNNRLRWRPGPQGRAMPFAKKRTSHLTVVVREIPEDVAETQS